MSGFFYVTDSHAIRKLAKSDGSETGGWEADHGAYINSVATDDDGNVYIGGKRVGTPAYTTRKYNSSGSLQWSVDHGGSVYGIAVDTSGNVYTGGNVVGSPAKSIRKYASNGDLTWSVDHGAAVYAVSVDTGGNVYIGGSAAPDGKGLRKYDSDGDVVWSVAGGFEQYSVALDTSANIHVVDATYATLSKYDTDGAWIWDVKHGGYIYYVAADATGNAYISGDAAYGEDGGPDDGMTIRKIDPDGDIVWSTGEDCPDSAYGIAVDPDGYLYVAAYIGEEGTPGWRKYDSLGDTEWTVYSDTENWAVDADPGVVGAGFWPEPEPVVTVLSDIVINGVTIRAPSFLWVNGVVSQIFATVYVNGKAVA